MVQDFFYRGKAKRIGLLFGLIIPLLGGGLMEAVDRTTVMKQLIPTKVDSWRAVKDDFYDPQSIFDYIDGAGEVYRAYNFQLLLARRFQGPEGRLIFVDLFFMGSPAEAFGVFTHDREGEKLTIGGSAVYKGGLLSFWKGSYFVSVYAEEETPATKEVVLRLGRLIAKRIKEDSPLPSLVRRLPTASLLPDEVRYFHNHLILNYHYFISEENILELDDKTEAVLGFYQFKEAQEQVKTVLLGIRYPGERQAGQAWRRFIHQYLPEAERLPQALVQTENGLWTGAQKNKNLIAIVFDAPSQEIALSLLTSFLQSL